jgi:hypothetical protein
MEEEEEDEDQDDASCAHHHHRGMVMDENQMFTPRITQQIRRAVKKSKAVHSRNGLQSTSHRSNSVRAHHQILNACKKRPAAATVRGTSCKSGCKRIRVNSNNNSSKVHQQRQKDEAAFISNGKRVPSLWHQVSRQFASFYSFVIHIYPPLTINPDWRSACV